MFDSSKPDMRSQTAVFMALTMASAAIVPLFSVAPVSAQLFPSSGSSGSSTNVSRQVVIPAGTVIPAEYKESEKILVTKEETVPLTLTVSANIKNRYGTILIPYGSQIVGEIRPAEEGSQFVAQTLILEDDIEAEDEQNEQPLEGTSEVITTTETIEEGASAGDILQGAAIGAAAATVVAAILGDKAIATEEVLGGAGLGALAGWILGKEEADLISIDTDTDLDVTLESDLVLTSNPN